MTERNYPYGFKLPGPGMDFPERQGHEFDRDLKDPKPTGTRDLKEEASLKAEEPKQDEHTPERQGYKFDRELEASGSRDLGDHIKDSGERSKFETGAVRDGRAGKGRFDLLPVMAMFRLAKHYERGCLKYGDRNWEKGIPVSKYIDSAIRHLLKAALGFADEHHLTSAAWNMTCAMETIDRIKLGMIPESLDDRSRAFYGVEYEAFEKLLNEVL